MTEKIGRGRLEAFSDGVIAIILTIMVLELKIPRDSTARDLLGLTPVFIAYVLSYLVVAIMWLNHHYLMHYVVAVNGRLLWFNILLLFWMSLIPFVTAWVGPHHLDPLPVALYGMVMFGCGAMFTLLRWEVAKQTRDEALREHHAGAQRKAILSACLYGASVGLAYVSVHISEAIYAIIPAIYFLPERVPQPASSPRSSIQ